MAQVSLEHAAAYYRIELPEIRRIGNEVRMRCFVNCGRKDETGNRALAIQPDHPAKIWRSATRRVVVEVVIWFRCAI